MGQLCLVTLSRICDLGVNKQERGIAAGTSYFVVSLGFVGILMEPISHDRFTKW